MKLITALAGAALALAACAAAQQHELTGRTPAPVMTFHGASWLERPGREEEERPEEVLDKMGLKDGDVVVDMGCGTGYFARRMAKRVAPKGKVYGVDIQPEMLELLKKYCERDGVTNVEPVLGEVEDPKLPAGTIDWMILTDVYHEFQNPGPMLEKMFEALKPDGRIALIEYRLLGDTAAHIKIEHRMSIEQVLAEWQAGGFELVDLLEFLPSQHFFIFNKDPDRVKLQESEEVHHATPTP